MPNCSSSDHQPTDVGNALIENVLSIPSPSTVYSGSLADGDLQSEVPCIQCDPALLSLSDPFLALKDGHEPPLLPPMISASSEGTSDECLQSAKTPHLHAALPRSFFFDSNKAVKKAKIFSL